MALILRRNYPWRQQISPSLICSWMVVMLMPRRHPYSTWSLQNHFSMEPTIYLVVKIHTVKIKYWLLENQESKSSNKPQIQIKFLNFRCKVQRASFLKMDSQESFILFFCINLDPWLKEHPLITSNKIWMRWCLAKSSTSMPHKYIPIPKIRFNQIK